jgi:glycosyltransferase involved in cell wall biosynthesis
VTLIVPVHNEATYIGRGLSAVLGQDYPSDRLEILVIDGVSTDRTRAIVEELGHGHPRVGLRLIENPGMIVATGMNIGLGLARGGIIVRVDGHCEIAPDYVRRCVEHITKDGVDGVGGSVDTVGETGTAEVIAAAVSTRFGAGDSAFRTEQGKTGFVDTVPFPAYSRSIIRQAGGYDEEFVRCQDDEYNYRLLDLGARILLAGDVHSRYYSRGTLLSLWNQYFQYGYWKVRVLQKHLRQMRPRQSAPPLFVLSLILSLCLTVLFPDGWISLAAIAGTYALASLAASLATAAKRGWRHLALLPVVYAILHLSYGLGFLVGLVKFWNRWGDKKGKVPELKCGQLGGRNG